MEIIKCILCVSICIFTCFSPIKVFSQQSTYPPLEVMAGQLLIIGFRGIDPHSSTLIINDIAQYHLGGVILFSKDLSWGTPGIPRNIANPVQLKQLTQALQAAARIPLFISIDQEGGKVSRLQEKTGFADFPSAKELGTFSLDKIQDTASQMGKMLYDLGINVNFAPVIDVDINPLSPAIGAMGRAFSSDPNMVALQGAAFGKALANEGIIPVYKHFPGYGSALVDPHESITDVTDTWTTKELIPYREIIKKAQEEGTESQMMIMSAHLMLRQQDVSYPASISQKIITGILREELGYTGLVVSDDLQMGAISKEYNLEEIVVNSLLAGADILLFGNNLVYDPDIVPKVVNIIINKVNDGTIPYERVVEAWERVTACKAHLTFE